MALADPTSGTSHSIPLLFLSYLTCRADQKGLALNSNSNSNSNNPFLNNSRPALPSPAVLGPQSAPIQQKSNNPFLAAFETDLNTSPTNPMNSQREPTIGEDAKELFVGHLFTVVHYNDV